MTITEQLPVIEPTPPAAATNEPTVMLDGGISRFALWLGLAVGTAMVSAAYVLAWSDPARTNIRYALLWGGLAVFLLPAFARLFDPLISRVERELVLLGLALFTVVPKFLRNPDGPLFFDELAHQAQSQRLLDNGELLARNPLIAVADAFPGLHAATAALAHLTGLSVWQVGVVIIVSAHLLSIFGIFRLAQLLTGNDRVSGIAAAVYALNPAFLFFNSQFAYQTLAITMLIWCLVFTVEASNPTADRRKRAGATALAIFLSSATIMTHHGSAFVLAGFLGIIALVLFIRSARGGVEGDHDGSDDQARDGAILVALVTGVTVALGIAWLFIGSKGDASRVIDYLLVYPTNGAQEAFNIITGEASGKRTVFSSSNLPVWVQALGFLAPPLALAAGIKGFLVTRKMRQPHPAFPAFVLVAALYAVSLPLVLTRTGAEGAHRSFPFTWIALAVLGGIGLAAWHREAFTRSYDRGRTVQAVLVTLMVVVGVGNLATNANDTYLFPGPWVAGSDTRAYDAELSSITTWFEGQDIDGRIIADIYTGAPIAALADPSTGCRLAAACPDSIPIWHAYYDDELGEGTVTKLADDGFTWIVVERRLAEELPRSGFWFTREEPDAFTRAEPLPAESLERFAGRPWAHRVLSTRHYDVFRLDFDQQTLPVDVSNPPVPDTATLDEAAAPAPAEAAPAEPPAEPTTTTAPGATP